MGWIAMALVIVALSVHRNWQVVVRDGALPGGRGVQDAARQLRLDVLCREQDQNHAGELTLKGPTAAPTAVGFQSNGLLFLFFSPEHAAGHHVNILTCGNMQQGRLWINGLLTGQRMSYTTILPCALLQCLTQCRLVSRIRPHP